MCRAHSGQHPSPTLAPVTAHTALPPSFSETGQTLDLKALEPDCAEGQSVGGHSWTQKGVPCVPGSLDLNKLRGRTMGPAGDAASLCFCSRMQILFEAPTLSKAEMGSMLARVPPFPSGVRMEVCVPG